MRLFRRRRDDEPFDPEERSPELGLKFKDLAVMGELMKAGADLDEPRHVVHYSYAPREDVAHSMVREAEERGFECEIREPLPEYPGQWAVICERYVALTPDFVRETGNFFDELAERYGAGYDGWEASV